jgi:hypothetical protein
MPIFYFFNLNQHFVRIANLIPYANLDCLGTGPQNRFRVGSKVVYRTRDLAEWLAQRSSVN